MASILYVRRGCRLCEAAEDMLVAVGRAPRLVDVDADAGLAARYGLRVPVLEIDGAVVMEGRFDERRLVAALGRPGRPTAPD